MSTSGSVNDGEFYPGCDFSISQLLYAAKQKLLGPAFGGRISTTMNQIEVDALERDTLEVLGLVRSVKNNLAPISKIPPDVFYLIPGYLENYDYDLVDEHLITMTHVCRGWRELLIKRPSLWTRLDYEGEDRTRVYIERSRLSPLEILLCGHGGTDYLEDVFLLVVPHFGRIKSLNIDAEGDLVKNLIPHFSCPAPLLSELTITHYGDPAPVLDSTLFNGDLPSLCSLSLHGVITHLPWKNLSKLTTFKLYYILGDKISITQILNFLEDAHQLRNIKLSHSIPTTSDAPPGRVVSLPCLKNLAIYADLVHSILLNHLSIPAGASLTLGFESTGATSLPDLLPRTLKNLRNIFPIFSVNLSLGDFQKCVQLDGPSGRLYMLGNHIGWEVVPILTLDRRILRSLARFDLSGTRRLAITQCEPSTADTVDKSTPYYILSLMKDLRTLTLTQCNNLPFNLPFIIALNPDQSSKYALCPKLEELILYVKGLESFNIEELMSMAKGRASAGMKLASLAVVGLGELLPGWEVFKLKEYITHVDYKVGEKPPAWDDITLGG